MSFFFRKKDSKAIRAKHLEEVKTALKGAEWKDVNSFDYTYILSVMPVKVNFHIPEEYPDVPPLVRVITACTHSWIDKNKTLSLCPEILNWSLKKDHSLVGLVQQIHTRFYDSPPVPDNSVPPGTINTFDAPNTSQNNNPYNNSNIYNNPGNNNQQNYGQQNNNNNNNNNNYNGSQNQIDGFTIIGANDLSPNSQQDYSGQSSQQQNQNPQPNNSSSNAVIIPPKITVLTAEQEAILNNASQIIVDKNEFSSLKEYELVKLDDALELVQHYALTHQSIAPLLQLREELLTALEGAIKTNIDLKSESKTIQDSIDSEQDKLRSLQQDVNYLLQRYKVCQEKFSIDNITSKLQGELSVLDDNSLYMHEKFISENSGAKTRDDSSLQQYLKEYMDSRTKFHLMAIKQERLLASK